MLSIDPTTEEKLSEIIDRGVKLPPMPLIGIELHRLISRPYDQINIEQVADLTEKDQTLAAKLLAIANSPYYTTAKNITRVKQAIVTMGLDETLGVLSYFMIRRIMPRMQPLPYFDPDDFWRHSLGCANIARMLGHPRYLMNSLPGELYLAGLLHDIGKIVMAIYIPGEYARCLEFVNQYDVPLEQIEFASMGVDHAMLGARLLDQWNIPNKILAGVGFHHQPDQAPEEFRQFAATIELANLLAARARIGYGGNPHHKPLEEAALRRDPKTSFAMPHVWETLAGELTAAALDRMTTLTGPTPAPSPREAETPRRPAPAAPAAPRPSIWRKILSLFR